MNSRTDHPDPVPIFRTPDYLPRVEPRLAGYATASDGVNLRYGVWDACLPDCKGTIILLQGRREYVEKSYETIRDFQQKGFAVLGFDWRGQGGSDRLLDDPRKGYVDSFEDYLLDLETIIENVALPDCTAPFYIVAHSTGALVALLAAPKIPNKIRRMVLCSTFLGFGKQPLSQSVIKLLSGAMSTFGLGDFYLSGSAAAIDKGLEQDNTLTSDQARFDACVRFVKDYPELSLGGPTANWVFSACKAMDQLEDPEFTSDITIPTLFLLAGNDRVVNNSATERLAMRLRSGSSLTIDGAEHELFLEADQYRELCLAAIHAFIPGSGA